MKKPLNKVSLALWIVAVLFVMAEAWTFVDMFGSASSFQGGNAYLVVNGVTRSLQSSIVAAAMLTAMGALIELIDQIRWTIVRAVEKT